MAVDYKNATFALWLSHWRSPGGGLLEGTVTEPDGAVFSFRIPGIPSPDPWKTEISPDGLYGVQWGGGAFEGKTHVRLLARV